MMIISRAEAIEAAAHASWGLKPYHEPASWWRQLHTSPDELAMVLAGDRNAGVNEIVRWLIKTGAVKAFPADPWLHAALEVFIAAWRALEPMTVDRVPAALERFREVPR